MSGKDVKVPSEPFHLTGQTTGAGLVWTLLECSVLMRTGAWTRFTEAARGALSPHMAELQVGGPVQTRMRKAQLSAPVTLWIPADLGAGLLVLPPCEDSALERPVVTAAVPGRGMAVAPKHRFESCRGWACCGSYTGE